MAELKLPGRGEATRFEQLDSPPFGPAVFEDAPSLRTNGGRGLMPRRLALARRCHSNQSCRVPTDPTLAPSCYRPRAWSTVKGNYPGVYREGEKFVARIALHGKWFYLGLYRYEWDAGQACKRANLAKRAGLLDACRTAEEVRRLQFGHDDQVVEMPRVSSP